MAEFNPFGQLAEVDRWKAQQNRLNRQEAMQGQQNALANKLQERRIGQIDQEQALKHLQILGPVAKKFLELPQQARQSAYRPIMSQLEPVLGLPAEPEYTPEIEQNMMAAAKAYDALETPDYKLQDTTEGVVYLPETIQPGSKAPTPIKVEGIKSSATVKEQKQALKDAKEKKKTDFKNANDLRDEYNTQSKTFVQVRDSYGRVLESSNNPSPAGDLALIFNYMKMLDPGSVVRESEFANAASTGAYGERVKAAVGKVATGERLSDVMRKDFLDRSKMLFNRTKKNQDKLQSEYSRLANAFEVDPSSVIVDYSLQGETEQAQPAGEIIFMGFE